jgi:hypothetical protein
MQKIYGLEFKVCIEPTRKKMGCTIIDTSHFYIHISIINRSDQKQLNARKHIPQNHLMAVQDLG